MNKTYLCHVVHNVLHVELTGVVQTLGVDGGENTSQLLNVDPTPNVVVVQDYQGVGRQSLKRI